VPSIDIHGETLTVLPDRALYWPARRTLLLADIHLGKSSTFGLAGIPVPDTTDRTLRRLDRLILDTGADRLVILGDLIHAPEGRSSEIMQKAVEWRNRNARVSMLLVRGNHDVRSGDPPAEWGIECVDAPWLDSPFALCHEPEECVRYFRAHAGSGPPYGLCGHVHPVCVMADSGISSVRAPCLWMTRTHAVLPSFGDFTGGKRIRPSQGDRVFLYGDGQVMEVPCV